MESPGLQSFNQKQRTKMWFYLQGRAIWQCMEDLLFRAIFPENYAFQFSSTLYLFFS